MSTSKPSAVVPVHRLERRERRVRADDQRARRDEPEAGGRRVELVRRARARCRLALRAARERDQGDRQRRNREQRPTNLRAFAISPPLVDIRRSGTPHPVRSARLTMRISYIRLLQRRERDGGLSSARYGSDSLSALECICLAPVWKVPEDDARSRGRGRERPACARSALGTAEADASDARHLELRQVADPLAPQRRRARLRRPAQSSAVRISDSSELAYRSRHRCRAGTRRQLPAKRILGCRARCTRPRARRPAATSTCPTWQRSQRLVAASGTITDRCRGRPSEERQYAVGAVLRGELCAIERPS